MKTLARQNLEKRNQLKIVEKIPKKTTNGTPKGTYPEHERPSAQQITQTAVERRGANCPKKTNIRLQKKESLKRDEPDTW